MESYFTQTYLANLSQYTRQFAFFASERVRIICFNLEIALSFRIHFGINLQETLHKRRDNFRGHFSRDVKRKTNVKASRAESQKSRAAKMEQGKPSLRHFSYVIENNHTEFILNSYSNCLFITITQLTKFGTVVCRE
jgi:hypothetical protein